jgi:hypothetical protein
MPVKISELPLKNNLQPTDVFPVVDSEFYNYKTSAKQILDLAKKNSRVEAEIKKILTSEYAQVTNLNLKESIDEKSFLRLSTFNFPSGKGWVKNVSNVRLGGIHILPNDSFSFCPDRQIFYFLSKKTGRLIYSGFATTGQLSFLIEADKLIFGRNNASLSIEITEVLSVAFLETLYTDEEPSMLLPEIANVPFFFNRETQTLLMKTFFSAASAEVGIRTNLSGICNLKYRQGINETINNGLSLDVPVNLYEGIDQIFVNDEILDASLYTFSGNSINFSQPIENLSLVKVISTVVDEIFVEYITNFQGSQLSLPTEVLSVDEVVLKDLETYGLWSDQNQAEWKIYAASLDKTVTPNYIHLGGNFPESVSGDSVARDIRITARGKDGTIYSFTIKNYWNNNLIDLPYVFDDIETVKVDGENIPPVIDSFGRLIFTEKVSGLLEFNAKHVAYEGLSSGGETIKIIEEVPGLQATTCGTGEHVNTLINGGRSDYNGSAIWKEWYGPEYDWVTIINDNNLWIYQDEEKGAESRIKNGFTDSEIKPVTSKLPLAPIWPQARIDDSSFFNVGFYPYDRTPFSSSTFLSLDDTKRVGESQMYNGKVWQMSNNTISPVRGVQGLYINGAKPLYFSGDLYARILLATYKWFVVECVDNNFNEKLVNGKKYLLCVNNVHYERKSILCEITSSSFNVAADLFPCEIA